MKHDEGKQVHKARCPRGGCESGPRLPPGAPGRRADTERQSAGCSPRREAAALKASSQVGFSKPREDKGQTPSGPFIHQDVRVKQSSSSRAQRSEPELETSPQRPANLPPRPLPRSRALHTSADAEVSFQGAGRDEALAL
ncbi:hypothetical protein EYF80_028555 [Liparis tanakae]|uniref:Uncharacterized protein n=1 Tax=Liparis tanakae TaxID=230148 RepID=A0A4Z2H6X7_9TELE|nr:hypothetical protein EYF80_028555 [Liparis tanakae]